MKQPRIKGTVALKAKFITPAAGKLFRFPRYSVRKRYIVRTLENPTKPRDAGLLYSPLLLHRDDDNLKQTDDRTGKPGPERVDLEIVFQMTLPISFLTHREEDSTGSAHQEDFYPLPCSFSFLKYHDDECRNRYEQ